MTDILRIYDPIECDDQGVPLGWERCRRCKGDGRIRFMRPGNRPTSTGCPDCGGHGSLKALALAMVTAPILAQRLGETLKDHAARQQIRCEGCGHPMSDGAWALRNSASGPVLLPEDYQGLERFALDLLRRGAEPVTLDATHWSPCDEGCRHSGALRIHSADGGPPTTSEPERNPLAMPGNGTETAGALVERMDDAVRVEASWRAVDVRAGMLAKRAGLDPLVGPLIARPFDLRPENLAVLCQRCWAVPS